MKKILLIIEDDFEVMGNGLGNTAYHQYIPGNFLQNLCENLNIRMSFMVDVVHILELKKYAGQSADLKFQVRTLENTLRQMAERGFDVQLHLHPQWFNAAYKAPFFYLNKCWNLGQYKPEEQKQMIEGAVEYLTNLLVPIKSDYKLRAFKAGSWGLQPSENLLNTFVENGFKVITGPRKDMYIPSGGLDYRGMEEDTLPYYPDFKDIRKIGVQGDLAIIPMAYYSPDIFSLGKLSYHLMKTKLCKRRQGNSIFYNQPVPKEVSGLNGISDKKILKLAWHPYLTQLKMSIEPFSYLKKSFDTVHKRILQTDADTIPVLLESHTKHYMANYENISRFLRYIAEKYSDTVEFVTFSDYIDKYMDKTKILHR